MDFEEVRKWECGFEAVSDCRATVRGRRLN